MTTEEKVISMKEAIVSIARVYGLNFTVYDVEIAFVDQEQRKIVALWSPTFTMPNKIEDVPPAKFLSLEIVSRAIKAYCCDLIDSGKVMVEVTEFNADLQNILEYYIGEKDNGTS